MIQDHEALEIIQKKNDTISEQTYNNWLDSRFEAFLFLAVVVQFEQIKCIRFLILILTLISLKLWHFKGTFSYHLLAVVSNPWSIQLSFMVRKMDVNGNTWQNKYLKETNTVRN